MAKTNHSNVYLVRHTALDTLRVAKVIRKADMDSDTILREARLIKNLKHSHIPVIYDIEEDDISICIIEEYISGKSLRSYINDTDNIKTSEICDIAVKLCDILEYLHNCDNEIIHLDIKPDNIIIDEHNNDPGSNVTVHLKFKNHFFERISHQCSLVNWVDIENEYYSVLKELLQEENPQKQNESIRTLNKEFDDVKRLLEKYLTGIIEKTEIAKHQSIQDAFSSFVEFDDIANCKQTVYVNSIFAEMVQANTIDEFEHDKKVDNKTYKYCLTENEARIIFIEKKLKDEAFKKFHLLPYTLLLNFNYTQIAKKLYNDHNIDEIINIHGELNSENNPIIFGYGDELDDDYNKIEKLQNNDFLENIKSISYHKTRSYRELLNFISLGPYQVFIMGHSCGNSDRTLLNTLFEHDNCISIKVFYRQYEDGADNYIDLIKNISRNFNNKPNMRDIVVNRENCSPLVPTEKEVAE